MLERLQRMNDEWDARGTEHWRSVGLPDFKVRIGLHSGSVIVGNVGSQQRTKYAVIGDTVNTAARIEALNKTLQTVPLMSEATRQQIAPGDWSLRDMGTRRQGAKRGGNRLYD